jgi:hypothetical protein
VRFTRGYVKAAEYARDPANKEEIIRLVAKALDMKEEDSRLAYEDTIAYFPRDGMPTIEGTRMALESFQQFGDIKDVDRVQAERLITTEFVTAAKAP